MMINDNNKSKNNVRYPNCIFHSECAISARIADIA